MPKFYPDRFPEAAASDPRRSAERTVYQALSDHLGDDYTVLYGVAWLTKHGERRAREGEADFVLAHPEKGLLVLEVKGGRISRDGRTGRWSSLDRAGEAHKIGDPAKQASDNMHSLKNKIRECAHETEAAPFVGYAVAFPNCDSVHGDLGPDLPRAVIVYDADLQDITVATDRILEYWTGRGRGNTGSGKRWIEIIVDVLAPTFELRTKLGTALRAEDERVIKLTEDQFRVLDGLSRNRRVAIFGGAGTGKTLLALEKARRLAREGFKVLMTCFNLPLAGHLQDAARGIEGLTVEAFHEFCKTRATAASIELPEYHDQSPEQYYNEILPAALEQALNVDQDGRYDAVIVDEAQDFHGDWLTLLELCQKQPGEDVLYVFYDDNQSIYRQDFVPPEGLVEFLLPCNLRNSTTIFEIASRFHDGNGVWEKGERPGREVEFIEVVGEGEVCKELSGLLHRLVNEEGIAAHDIAVLTGRSVKRSALADVSEVGAFRLADMGDIGRAGTGGSRDLPSNTVTVESIYRFKGLERPVIILTGLEPLLDAERSAILYVGMTRARGHLIVIDTAEVIARLGGPSA